MRTLITKTASTIFLLCLMISRAGSQSNQEFISYSYEYYETVHEKIFKYEENDPEYLSFDFDIRILEFDTSAQYALFEFVFTKVYESNRKKFDFLEQIIDKPFKIEYHHNKDVKWLNITSTLDPNSKNYRKNLTKLVQLKVSFQELILKEFGLFDILFSDKSSKTGNKVACDAQYDFKKRTEINEIDSDEIESELIHVYNQETLRKNFTHKLDEYIENSIQLNIEWHGQNFDTSTLDEHKKLKKENLNQVFDNFNLAEDVIFQKFKYSDLLPYYSEARYYNIQNICSFNKLSMYYEVFLERL